MDNQLIESDSFLEETIALKGKIEESFLILGQRLSVIRKKELWVGGQYVDFHDFLEHAKIPQSTASKLISIYENLIEKFEISPDKVLAIGDWSNAYEVSTLKTLTPERMLEVVETAALVTRNDLRKIVQEIKTGKSEEMCLHDDTYKVDICNKCGRRIKVYE